MNNKTHSNNDHIQTLRDAIPHLKADSRARFGVPSELAESIEWLLGERERLYPDKSPAVDVKDISTTHAA